MVLICAKIAVQASKHLSHCHKADLKINIASCATACVNDYMLIPTLKEYALYSGSAVLLKLKGDDHVLLHVASTCHSRALQRNGERLMCI